MKIHIVKKGDTLYEIAKKHHVEIDKLIAANPHIADPDHLDVGLKVKIPFAHKTAPIPPAAYAHKHIVVQGDTLWKLSKAWNIPLKDIIDANPHIKNPSILMTGDVVYIPSPASGPNPPMHIHGDPKGTAAKLPEIQDLNVLPSEAVKPEPQPKPEKAEPQPVNLPPNLPPNVSPLPNLEPMAEAEPAELKPEKTEKPEKEPAPEFELKAAEPNVPLAPPTPVIDKELQAEKAEEAEKAEKAKKSLCPPLPQMEWPQLEANQPPFFQYHVPAVEVAAPFAAGYPPVYPPFAWQDTQLPHIPGMPPVYPAHFPDFSDMPAKAAKADCGCGGAAATPEAGYGLPYALPQFELPYAAAGAAGAGNAPFAMPMPQAFEPYAAAFPSKLQAGENMQPPAATNALPHMQQPFMFPQLDYGYPGHQMIYPGYFAPCYPLPGAAADPFPTYATPYANPYMMTGVEPFAAPHAPGMKEGDDGGKGRNESGEASVNSIPLATDAKLAGQEATKAGAVSRSAKGKGGGSQRAALHAFLNRRKGKSVRAQPKENMPWVNL